MSAPQVYLIDSKPESRTELAFSLQGGGMQVHAFASMPAFLQWLDYDAMPNHTCVVSELDTAEMNGREKIHHQVVQIEFCIPLLLKNTALLRSELQAL